MAAFFRLTLTAGCLIGMLIALLGLGANAVQQAGLGSLITASVACLFGLAWSFDRQAADKRRQAAEDD